MQDVAMILEHRPGALAEVGEALGRAGISIEGGGVFVTEETAVAHFLFDDGVAAAAVLSAAGVRVAAVRDVTIVRLRQAVSGQLGLIARRMAEAGVNIEVQYSDHANRLILVVDDAQRAGWVAAAWTADDDAR